MPPPVHVPIRLAPRVTPAARLPHHPPAMPPPLSLMLPPPPGFNRDTWQTHLAQSDGQPDDSHRDTWQARFSQGGQADDSDRDDLWQAHLEREEEQPWHDYEKS